MPPVLNRMAMRSPSIPSQLNELKRGHSEFDDIAARMDEGLVLFSAQGDILFANRAVCALFPEDSAAGGYMTLCRDPEYIRVVEEALGGESAHGRMEKAGRVYSLTASSVEEGSQGPAAVLVVGDITERDPAERQRPGCTANV